MGGGNVNSGSPQEGYSGGIAGTDTLPVPVLRGFSRSAKQDSEASRRRAEERAKRTLPVLRAGFTLVELIVTMLIAVILIAITITFLTSGSSFLARTETSASDKALAQGAADFIKDQLLYANEVKVVYVDDGDPVPPDPASLSGFIVLYIGGEDGKVANTGRLYYKRPDADEYADILGDGMYRGKDLAFEYNATVTTPGGGASKTAVFEVVAKAVRDGVQAKEARQTFRMYNIGLNSEPAVDASAVSWDGDSPADPGKNKKFYLLITPTPDSDDYVSAGLIMELSGIYNSIDSEGNPYHDPAATSYWGLERWADLSVLRDPSKTKAANDVWLTDNFSKPGDKWVPFKDYGYGESDNKLDLSPFDQITVEVCFRVDPTTHKAGALYETGAWDDPREIGMIGAYINYDSRYGNIAWGSAYTIGRQGNLIDDGPSEAAYAAGMRAYRFSFDPTRFTTHTTTYSCVDDPTGRRTFVDGVVAPYYVGDAYTGGVPYPDTTRTYTKDSPKFKSNNFFLCISATGTHDNDLYCDIASVRIYGRKLNPDEIARNAALDQLLYNG